MKTQMRIGISGWTYAPWRGVFFPEKWPQKRELEYASSKLTSIEVTADVTINTDGAEFWLTAVLEVVAGGADDATTKRLAELAHTICPYSKAITGNVPIEIVARAADQAA